MGLRAVISVQWAEGASDHLDGAVQNIAVAIEDDEPRALSEAILSCASYSIQLGACNRHGGFGDRARSGQLTALSRSE